MRPIGQNMGRKKMIHKYPLLTLIVTAFKSQVILKKIVKDPFVLAKIYGGISANVNNIYGLFTTHPFTNSNHY